MDHDREQGNWDEAKGKVKEGAGKLAGDRSTEMSGKADQLKGGVEKKVADVKDAAHRKSAPH